MHSECKAMWILSASLVREFFCTMPVSILVSESTQTPFENAHRIPLRMISWSRMHAEFMPDAAGTRVHVALHIEVLGIPLSQTGFLRHASSMLRFLDASSRSFFDSPVSSTLPSLWRQTFPSISYNRQSFWFRS